MATRVRRYHRQPHLWLNPKSRVWYVVWSEGGRPRRHSTRTRERVTAENVLAQLLRDRAQDPTWRAPRRLTLRAAAAEWVALKSQARFDLKGVTLKEYRTFARRISETVPASLHVDAATPRDLRLILEELERRHELGALSMKKVQNHLSMLFRWLHREGVVPRNPAASLERVKTAAPAPRGVTEEEFARILAAIEADLLEGAPPRARADAAEVRDLIEVLWNSGLRSIEAYRLSWSDLDLPSARWVIRSPANKGGVRELPMHPRVVEILARRRLRALLQPFPRYATENAWGRFRGRHGRLVRRMRLHDLRHAFITRLVSAGNLAAARHLGRHRTPAMTDLYSQVTSDTFREALRDLG